MNERIKLLAIQAAEFVEENSVNWTPQDFEQKFAELIVKECATTCDNISEEARKEWKAKHIPHDDGRVYGAWECKAAILEQFGVEE